MAKNNQLTILGIVAVLAIVGLVLLFTTATTGRIAGRIGHEGSVQYPSTIATEYCNTVNVDLNVDKEVCQAQAFELCQVLNQRNYFPRGSAGSNCIVECYRDARNQCQVAGSIAQGPPHVSRGLRYREV